LPPRNRDGYDAEQAGALKVRLYDGELAKLQSAVIDRRYKILPRSLSDLLTNIISSSGHFIGMAGICLDRLLKQRSALRKPDLSFDLPPPRGGLRSLSVAADCIATKSRALSGLLS
jgi:hypothetical protein